MTRKELDIMTAIFDAIHAFENLYIRSCNDCWIEIDEVNISQQEMDRVVAEVKTGPSEIDALVKLALIEVDQSVEPATSSEKQSTCDYSLAIHKNQQRFGFCVHRDIAGASACKLNHPYENEGSEALSEMNDMSDDEPF